MSSVLFGFIKQKLSLSSLQFVFNHSKSNKMYFSMFLLATSSRLVLASLKALKFCFISRAFFKSKFYYFIFNPFILGIYRARRNTTSSCSRRSGRRQTSKPSATSSETPFLSPTSLILASSGPVPASSPESSSRMPIFTNLR